MGKKSEAVFACAKCGAQFLKWAGRCTECAAWGSLSEEIPEGSSPAVRHEGRAAKTQSFSTLASSNGGAKELTGVAAWDRVLAGGLTAGSVTLLGGEPGIGKSTLLAQIAIAMAAKGKTVCYVTGEESPSQVLLRLRRLSPIVPPTLEFLDRTEAETIAATIREHKPSLTIVDSIQTLRVSGVAGEAGNPTQVKASAAVVSEAAKQTHCAVILVGQVTKDGDLAGPRLLEHLVDTVAMMEGDRFQSFRWLHLTKHRFGSTEESAIMSMSERGMEEVLDPSAALLADRPRNVAGAVATCLAQGTRPVLVEIQALVTPAGYGTPSRRATGIDANRLSLLLAVLGRRAGVSFADQDVFVNAVGGIDAKDPSVDLAIALALVSAKTDKQIPSDVVAWGEIGLSGEVRAVSASNLRTKEAARLGLTTVVAPKEKSPMTLREAISQLHLSS